MRCAAPGRPGTNHADVKSENDISALEVSLRVENHRRCDDPPPTLIRDAVPHVVTVTRDVLGHDLLNVLHHELLHGSLTELPFEVSENLRFLLISSPQSHQIGVSSVQFGGVPHTSLVEL